MSELRTGKIAVVVAFLLGLATVGATQSNFNINMDSVRSSVVFMHFRDAQGTLKEAGTGFLVAAPSKSLPGQGYYLLITARHIVDPEWAHCARIPGSLFAVFNTKPSGTGQPGGILELPLFGSWTYPAEDSADVAVIVLSATYYNGANIENKPVSTSELPRMDEAAKIDTGSQIVSAGLLIGASGIKRNYPIFKFGYVSSKPEEDISVSCIPGGLERPMKEWMIAASLVPGNSGSPILFVPPGANGVSFGGGRPFLLGVQSMSFIGSDVAGMTPARYLIDAIRRLGIADMDLSQFDDHLQGPPATPTATGPQVKPLPLPFNPPHQ